ncbi:MAG: hypothetical protein HY901_05855 [Deltaproteobacteria bacterium]|nr:hypothetical protein [Deltaproteobacteria bacterium]
MASRSRRQSSWDEADFEYSQLQAELLVFPEMRAVDLVEGLEDLARRHPDFYPAALELGMRQLYAGTFDPGEDNLRRGLELFLRCKHKRTPKEEIEDAENVALNLHDMMRFDLTVPFLRKMVERHPRANGLWNLLGNALAMLGDHEGAWEASGTAVKLAPRDGSRWTDRALIALMAGRLDDAEKALSRALALGEDESDGIVAAHRRVLAYLRSHIGLSYLDYLLRPHDDEALELLEDDERDLDEENAVWNEARLLAMGLERLRSGKIETFTARARALRLFYKSVGRGVLSDYTPLWEDLEEVRDLEEILNTFVIRHTDGAEALEDVCGALLDLHSFLASHGLVDARALKKLRGRLETLRPQVAERARRYRESLERDSSPERREALVRKFFRNKHRIAFF